MFVGSQLWMQEQLEVVHTAHLRHVVIGHMDCYRIVDFHVMFPVFEIGFEVQTQNLIKTPLT